MQWDIFCRVVDNFGDIGVCWRLSRDLAARGEQVRLWVDDPSALAWMAPQVDHQGLGAPGIQVVPWVDGQAMPPGVQPGDVVIEAFGCHPPDDFVARMHRPAPPCWVNLEYLSAEDYVERSHGLASPMWSGVAAGLHKRFFYPGFTPRTGGLLREPGLLHMRDQCAQDPMWRAQASQRWGIDLRDHERLVTLFCYEGAPVSACLDALVQTGVPCQVLLTPGPATRQALAWRAACPSPPTPTHLRLTELPPLPQPAFDHLLWLSDFNVVRGEDSAVRALWAERPHLWHIYPQDDGVHANKLDAFMDRWLDGWPDDIGTPVRQLWGAFNGLAPQALLAPALTALWHGPAWAQWQALSRQSAANLARQDDLVTQLLDFVIQPG